MFRFRIENCYDEKFLTKLVDKFLSDEVPVFRKLQAYYDVQTDILSRTMDAGKPNNKIAHGFARYISNMATSYFMGKPIKYVAENEEYQELLQKELGNNYIGTVNYEASKEASKKGISFLLLFLDEAGTLRIRKCEAETMIPVYSPKLGEFLEGAVRIWNEYDIDGNLLVQGAALYDKREIRTYKRSGIGSVFQLEDVQKHMMDDIPVIVIWNNEEACGDYGPHISLIDAYDKAQSDTANDMEYFSDAYLCISGAGELTENIGADEGEEPENKAADLRRNRILFLDEHGQAQWLVKNINDTAAENYKDRLYGNLFFLAQVPALSDESFAGNLTGVAIKYKLIGLEELAIMKQSKFEAAQKKLVKLVTNYINLKYNKDFDPETVQQKYERNFVANDEEIITNVKNLEGIISDETQLRMLPASIVPDVRAETEKIRKEAAMAEGIPYIEDRDLEMEGHEPDDTGKDWAAP